MRTLLILLFVLILAFSSCTRSEKVASLVNPETPKALQEENIMEDIVDYSKRGKSDLIDALYREQVAKRSDLKEIETLIEKIKEDQADAVDVYERYNGKNDEYYFSANEHLSNISDSVLRTKMLAVMSESKRKYQNKSAKLGVLVEQIKSQSISITDYREALKIVITIPLIEKFQDENQPNDSLYRKIIRDQKVLTGKINNERMMEMKEIKE